MLCDICVAIDRAIFSERDFPIQLGRAGSIRQRASYCASCTKICAFLNADRNQLWDSGTALLELNQSKGSRSEFYVTMFEDGFHSSSSCLRMLQENASGVLVHSHLIDVDKIRRWLRHCDEQHTGKCHKLSTWQTIAPSEILLLIDVRLGCLVEMPGTIEYCTLSYVWGLVPDSLETRLENIELLKQKGSITPENSKWLLPETIRDAIRLIRSLGQHYLWVDRLCIIQNDRENKHMNIMRMDSIYSNSYLTIVAADGPNANYGLPGVVGGLRPRSGIQCIIDFPQGTLVSDLLRRKDENKDGFRKIYRRGWTFQELRLSRRTVVFSDKSATWGCQVSLWDEDTCGIPEGIEYLHRKPLTTLPFTQWPDIRTWADTVREYNLTDLTFPGDAQAAFSGIENVLQRSFPSGLFCGLPEFYFDWALLWQSVRPMERRMAINSLTGHKFPSWSWLGWKGYISLRYCLLVCEEYWKDSNLPSWRREGYDSELEPLVKWTHVGSSLIEERQIQNNWYKTENWKEGNENTTRNWRLKWVEGEDWYINALADGVLFRYPLPWTQERVPEQEQNTWPPHLRVRSSTATFTITRLIQTMYNEMTPKNWVIISDRRGQVAGTLFLDRTLGLETSFGRERELLMISRGKATLSDPGSGNFFPEIYESEIRKSQDVFEFYNVLYVEWEEGHMVREGIGRVETSIWEQQDLKEIDAELH